MKSCVSVSEAAKIKKVTRQAIYLAIRLKRLKAYKHDEKWQVFMTDLKEYDAKRFSRIHHSKFNGKLIFDETKGYLSIDGAAKKLGIHKQKLYYAARKGVLKATRKNSAWVIQVKDLFDYQSKHLKKTVTKRARSG